MNKYLVFSSIGNNSVHNTWLNTENRTFDVVLAYYANNDEYYNKIAEKNSDNFLIYKRKGFKWPNFNDYISNNDVSQYEYIWIPDDDIELSGDKINEMFKTLEKYPNIMVAIPSTSKDSVNSNNKPPRPDRHNCNLIIEYKNFLECGLLLINGSMLNNTFFRKILNLTNTGYFLDILMKFCFDEKNRKISQVVLHDIIARHPKRTINNLSDMTKMIPRKQHKNDRKAFIENNISPYMLRWSICRHSVIRNNDKCIQCYK
jgi:hypothetical protein